MIHYGWQCGFIVITFTFDSFIHITIDKLFQVCGNMIIPMVMQIFGAVVNIILDSILIFGYFGLLALRVSGAAIVTIIGQMSACLISTFLFIKCNRQIHLSFRH